MEDTDIFTIEEFTIYVDYGGFTDYDGIGYLATKDENGNIQKSNIEVECRVSWLKQLPKYFTHVCWYNK